MLEVGDRIDVWVVTQRLGHGGMGSVYRCHNVDATRIEAAIKVLADSVTSSEEGRRRFVREAEILYRVQHPNVVAVRNIRMDAHPPFIEMEFVDGRALHEVIDEGPQSEADVRSWMRQLAEALEHLHGLGIRHRDIKPANLLLTSDGLLKLVDFGLALETDEDRLTREGMTFGTVSYAPPEWMDPASLDPVQWDLYALGVVFYELLTGSFAYPLSGEGPLRKQLLQVALAKQNSPPLDPGEGVSEGTRTLVRRLTTREPDDRPASATEVLELLTASEEGRLRDLPPPVAVLSEAEAPPAPPPPSTPPTRSLRAMVIGAVALSTVGVVLFAAQQRPSAPTAAPPPAPEVSKVPVRLMAAGLDGMVMQVELDGAVRGVPPEGLATQLAVGEQTVPWWVGPCDVDACPGEACSPACGSGEALLVVPEGADGEAMLAIDVTPPQARFVVEVPALAEAGGLFKKRPPLVARLGDRRLGAVDETSAALLRVAPGEYELTVSLGTCPPAAVGCHPGGCPKGCRSERSEVVVPWSSDTVTVRSRLSLPD